MLRFLLLLMCPLCAGCQQNDSDTLAGAAAPGDGYRPDSAWESRYKERLDNFLDSKDFYMDKGFSDPDAGKRAWPALLTNLYKHRQDSAKIKRMINDEGNMLMFSKWAGNMCKPFTLPGYTMYYLTYKDLLPQKQKTEVYNTLYKKMKPCESGDKIGWEYLMRGDGYMDPIYELTEFNSENFNWMARMGGYLLAEDFDDEEKKAYFKSYLKNWIRALYNAGRVEWNSNIYWGHCFNPLLVLYTHAKDPEVKLMAKAGLDRMVTEAALHYIDGFEAGGDVRAKNSSYLPFSGSVWGYSYFYFADTGRMPTYGNKFKEHISHEFTYIQPYTDYRPPVAVIELANRNFQMPVEIQSAKPFYQLDNDNYADWKGNTERSRRFEFETLYLDSALILSSLASYRPDGKFTHINGSRRQGPFSEHNVWRLAVKGINNGALQIFGNSGTAYTDMAGRNPTEEICQSKGTMIRMNSGNQPVWVAVPKVLASRITRQGLFVDLGQGHYAAFVAHGLNMPKKMSFEKDTAYSRFNFMPSGTGCNVLMTEVAKSSDYQSFEEFIAYYESGTYTGELNDTQFKVNSLSGEELMMEYRLPVEYTTRLDHKISPAGTLANFYVNGKRMDYENWDAWKVNSGPEVVSQPWGGGFMEVNAGGTGLKISVDDDTALPVYK